MSSIFALTEDARRRVEGASRRCAASETQQKIPMLTEDNKELILLLIVLVMLCKAGADPILLLAIMYVTL